jgi:hypothetical protein
VVSKRAKWREHVNGWRFILDDDVWREAGVLDVSELLHEASERL